MVDEEQIKKLQKKLPDIPYVFISSVSLFGLAQLKDKLWELLNE
jgi:GTP-binding protein